MNARPVSALLYKHIPVVVVLCVLTLLICTVSCATTSRPKPLSAEELMAITGGTGEKEAAHKQREARKEKIFMRVAWNTGEKNAGPRGKGDGQKVPDGNGLATALLRSDAFLHRLDGIRAQYPMALHRRMMLDTGTEVITTATEAPQISRVELWAEERRILTRNLSADAGYAHIGALTQARPLGFALQASFESDAVPLIFYAPISEGAWEPDPKTYLPVIPEIPPAVQAPVIKIIVFAAMYRGKAVVLSKPSVVYLHADADM